MFIDIFNAASIWAKSKKQTIGEKNDFYITLDENFEGTKTYEDSGIYYLTFKKIKLSSPSGNIHYVSGQPFGFTFVVR